MNEQIKLEELANDLCTVYFHSNALTGQINSIDYNAGQSVFSTLD